MNCDVVKIFHDFLVKHNIYCDTGYGDQKMSVWYTDESFWIIIKFQMSPAYKKVL
jgi:hypothetical protein